MLSLSGLLILELATAVPELDDSANAAPLFAKNDKICVIKPPQIIDIDQNTDIIYKDSHKEVVNVYLDEGVAQLTVYVGGV